MSAWERIETIAKPRPNARPPRRTPLRRVPPATGRRVSKVPFLGIMTVILALGMVGLLLLNTHLQDQTFTMRAAQLRASELAYRLSDLEAQNNRADSPAQLAGRATELGMVPNPHAVYLDLATSKIAGVPQAVRGDEMPSLRVQPTGAQTPPPQASTPVVTRVQPWIDLSRVTPQPPTSTTARAAKPATRG